MAPEVDEIIPVSRYMEGGYSNPTACALDPANVRLTHRICNERRGAGQHGRPVKDTRRAALPLSRDWSNPETWTDAGE